MYVCLCWRRSVAPAQLAAAWRPAPANNNNASRRPRCKPIGGANVVAVTNSRQLCATRGPHLRTRNAGARAAPAHTSAATRAPAHGPTGLISGIDHGRFRRRRSLARSLSSKSAPESSSARILAPARHTAPRHKPNVALECAACSCRRRRRCFRRVFVSVSRLHVEPRRAESRRARLSWPKIIQVTTLMA